MRLAIDNDFFCKLVSGGALDLFLEKMDVTVAGCFILPGLSPQLWKPKEGKKTPKIRKAYPDKADALLDAAKAFTVLPAATVPNDLLDEFTSRPAIDPGEAHLFAFAMAHTDVVICTGDKRALKEIGGIPLCVERLKGRIICVESAMLVLCAKCGIEVTHPVGVAVGAYDTSIQVCFDCQKRETIPDNLHSYFNDLKTKSHADLYLVVVV